MPPKLKLNRRTLIKAAFLLVLVYWVLEGLSCGVFWAFYGRPFSYAETNRKKAELARRDQDLVTKADFNTPEEWPAHPYVGHTLVPGRELCQLERETLEPCCMVNDYGFFGSNAFRGQQTFNVLITGGSVAVHTYCVRSLERQLGRLEALAGKKLALFAFAAAGYKQPQQSMALQYFLILGGKVDLVINIDGFNETAAASFRGVHAEVPYPVYPEQWGDHFIKSLDRQSLLTIGTIAMERAARRDLAQAAGAVNFSVTANLFWSWMDDLKARRIRTLSHELARARPQGRQSNVELFQRRGPRVGVPDQLALVTETWYLSSLQMAALARANGSTYLHVLQPSALVTGGKPLTAAERAFTRGRPGAIGSHDKAYASLRALGARLRQRGVAFADLSEVFKDQAETLYFDDCHFNTRGHAVFAERIAQALRSQLGAAAPGVGGD